MDNRKLSIGFWTKQSGKFATSVKAGLSREEVAELQALKPGDQLVVYINEDKRTDRSPDFSLRKFVVREGSDNDSGGL